MSMAYTSFSNSREHKIDSKEFEEEGEKKKDVKEDKNQKKKCTTAMAGNGVFASTWTHILKDGVMDLKRLLCSLVQTQGCGTAFSNKRYKITIAGFDVKVVSHSLYEYDDAPSESTSTCTVGPTIAPIDNSYKELQDTIDLAEAMEKELEMLMAIKDGKNHIEET
ncbi:hypothetical protein LXL04_014870 [Taraxacum kok-saghyz]